MKKIYICTAMILGLALGTLAPTANAADERIVCDSNGKQQSINGTMHTCAQCSIDGATTSVWYVGQLDGPTAESTCRCQHDVSSNCSQQSLQIIKDTLNSQKATPTKLR